MPTSLFERVLLGIFVLGTLACVSIPFLNPINMDIDADFVFSLIACVLSSLVGFFLGRRSKQ